VEVLGRNIVVNANYTSFKLAPKAFNVVGMVVANGFVTTFGRLDGNVFIEVFFKSFI